MNKKIFFIGVITIFLLSGIATAAEIIKKYNSVEYNTCCSHSLKISLTTDKYMYTWGSDIINITLTIENKGDEEQIINYPIGMECEFIVRNCFGWEVYRNTEGVIFPPGYIELRIQPNETEIWNFSWDQTGHLFRIMPHRQLWPGRYYICHIIPLPPNNKFYEFTTKISVRRSPLFIK
jgi:hypothetical protein